MGSSLRKAASDDIIIIKDLYCILSSRYHWKGCKCVGGLLCAIAFIILLMARQFSRLAHSMDMAENEPMTEITTVAFHLAYE